MEKNIAKDMAKNTAIKNEEIFEVFEKLVAIDSPSLQERKMADHVKALFAGIGVSLEEDATQSITGSDAGNLFGKVEAEGAQEKESTPVLFAAHMDTVNPALGKKAILHEDGTVTSDGTTVLGADDLSGVTAIYEAVKYIKENKLSHRPIEILITVGEELYCKGANAFDYSKVTAKEAYVLDLSTSIGTAAYAAPTLVSFEAVINGKAAHADFIQRMELTVFLLPQKRLPYCRRVILMRSLPRILALFLVEVERISFQRAAISAVKSEA